VELQFVKAEAYPIGAEPKSLESNILSPIPNSQIFFSLLLHWSVLFFLSLSFFFLKSERKIMIFFLFIFLLGIKAESQLQLSPNLIKIMEQRLSAIEHRSACLENFMNQVI